MRDRRQGNRLDQNHRPFRSQADSSRIQQVSVMDQRIVENPTTARQGTKEGVVRYVLIISTVLVVILFAVAYKFVV